MTLFSKGDSKLMEIQVIINSNQMDRIARNEKINYDCKTK